MKIINLLTAEGLHFSLGMLSVLWAAFLFPGNLEAVALSIGGILSVDAIKETTFDIYVEHATYEEGAVDWLVYVIGILSTLFVLMFLHRGF